MGADVPSQCEQVAQWLRESKRAVVLSGAGISTESGIPDFRSPGGVWSKYRTVYFDEFLASPEGRTEYWRQKAEAHRDFAHAQPNAGHRVLAAWEAAGRIRGVITQNIDGLHQLAGSREVLELHGTARQAACLDCGHRMPIEPLVEEFFRTHSAPPCPQCDGRIKHATVSFGQPLPSRVLDKAAQWSQECDLMLAIGSSLVVTPAADLPLWAARSGARLVIVNRDETPLDRAAAAVLRAPIGKTLAEIDSLLKR
jgi:NAD-dependent deacetylase